MVFPDATARHFWTEHKIHYSVAVISKKSIKKKVVDNSSQSSSSKSGDSSKQNTSAKKEKATSTSTGSNTGNEIVSLLLESKAKLQD